MSKEMKQTHTPGPWKLIAGYSIPRIVAEYDYAIAIADMPFWKVEHWEERLANAALIAAAPELLKALKSYLNVPVLPDMGHEDQLKKAIDSAQDAIAKAEGRDK